VDGLPLTHVHQKLIGKKIAGAKLEKGFQSVPEIQLTGDQLNWGQQLGGKNAVARYLK
jgi:hypothetical protein